LVFFFCGLGSANASSFASECCAPPQNNTPHLLPSKLRVSLEPKFDFVDSCVCESVCTNNHSPRPGLAFKGSTDYFVPWSLDRQIAKHIFLAALFRVPKFRPYFDA
jgi:hypothetical protein